MQTSITILRGRGLTPDEVAAKALAKLIQTAEEAPAPIRDQVHKFRSKIGSMLAGYMREAAHGDRMTVYNAIKDTHPDLARMIMKL